MADEQVVATPEQPGSEAEQILNSALAETQAETSPTPPVETPEAEPEGTAVDEQPAVEVPQPEVEQKVVIGGKEYSLEEIQSELEKASKADEAVQNAAAALRAATQRNQEAAAKEKRLAELEAKELERELDQIPLPEMPVKPEPPDWSSFETADDEKAARKEYAAALAAYDTARRNFPIEMMKAQELRAQRKLEVEAARSRAAAPNLATEAQIKEDRAKMEAWANDEARSARKLTQEEATKAYAIAYQTYHDRVAEGYNPSMLDLFKSEVRDIYASRKALYSGTETAAKANARLVQESTAMRAPAMKPLSSPGAVAQKPKLTGDEPVAAFREISIDEVLGEFIRPG